MKKTTRFRSAVAVLSFAAAVVALHALPIRPKSPTLPVRPVASALAPADYSAAADALRQGNLQSSRQLLREVAAHRPAEAAHSRVLEGLYAHEQGERALAEELLAGAAEPGGRLEDWRLFLLAEDAAANGHEEVAQGALARLTAGCPDSPLAPLAFVRSVRLARERGREQLALERIAAARRAGITGEAAAEIEDLAWSLGRQLDDPLVQREAALRLLAEDPLQAGALEVADHFHAFGDDLDWNRLLSTRQVRQRAQRFLAAEVPPAALKTLETMPEGERDVEWRLLKARALTEAERGGDALALLAPVRVAKRRDGARLEWARALAAADLGTATGGGRGLTQAERRRMLEASHRHLENVVRFGGGELSVEALRRLYADFQEAELFEPAMDALRMLRRVDPWDTTGTRDLWERGWAEYRRGNTSGAVGYWTELAAIYPEQGDAQRGRYWKARALEALGQPERARDLYRDLVAVTDTTDFYHRQAVVRLGGEPGAAAATRLAGAPGPWPRDPVLRRAKLLTDLGLDGLALREMEIVEKRADSRDLLALRGLIRARRGDLRGSMAVLRQAYPALGGPSQGGVPAEVLRAYYPVRYAAAIREEAGAQGLPPSLVAGIIRQESSFDPRATSPVGARGLMQLMPETARETSRRLGYAGLESRLYEPEVSVRLGAAYFRQVLDQFDGNVELALAGYNGGPSRIRRLWREAGGEGASIDEFFENLGLEESRDYVKRILVLADSYRQLRPELG